MTDDDIKRAIAEQIRSNYLVPGSFANSGIINSVVEQIATDIERGFLAAIQARESESDGTH